MNEKSIEKLLSICRVLNLTIRFGAGVPQYKPHKRGAWIILSPRFDELCLFKGEQRNDVLFRLAREISHEIGHYLVTPRSRRRRKDFGIPTKLPYKTRYKYDLEDLKADAIEYDIMYRIGFNKAPVAKVKLPTEIKEWHQEHGRLKVDMLFDLAR